jgi:phosphoenolpyruvate-protein phosphotransferase
MCADSVRIPKRAVILKGVPASPGIAIGPAFRYAQHSPQVERRVVADPEEEWKRLEAALSTAAGQLEELKVRAAQSAGEEEAAIFDAHLLILRDPTLLESVRQAMTEQKINVEAAWMEAIESSAAALEALQDAYFRARGADVRDVGQRVLRLLLGVEESDLSSFREPAIVVATDLTPSDTVRLDKSLVLGFCTAQGGATSHTAILAKALGLPAVVGAGPEVETIRSGDPLLLDGEAGEVVVSPDEETTRHYAERRRTSLATASREREHARQPAITPDGKQVEVVANIGGVDEARIAIEFGAEGVGLLRTEFLYLDRQTAPSEEEQFQAYRTILEVMERRPVVVRTLDVGGDKPLPYLDLGHEANPFLGWRAIRMCLDRPDFFKVQLRALLRASPGHDLRIMFPMIADIEEVRRARAFLDEARSEVLAQGQAVAEHIQVGIMVEIPSVAMLADHFAREVDFFSIGTNDLTQYTLAADRTHAKLAHLSDPCHPAVLREIDRVINAAHERGIWVGLCGEMAGDPEAAPLLLGLGLDEFSMAPSSVPGAKTVLRRWSFAKAQELARQALDLPTAAEVRALVRSWKFE